jgi:hypothetical protein
MSVRKSTSHLQRTVAALPIECQASLSQSQVPIGWMRKMVALCPRRGRFSSLLSVQIRSKMDGSDTDHSASWTPSRYRRPMPFGSIWSMHRILIMRRILTRTPSLGTGMPQTEAHCAWDSFPSRDECSVWNSGRGPIRSFGLTPLGRCQALTQLRVHGDLSKPRVAPSLGRSRM